jgi:hypothetical protein
VKEQMDVGRRSKYSSESDHLRKLWLIFSTVLQLQNQPESNSAPTGRRNNKDTRAAKKDCTMVAATMLH